MAKWKTWEKVAAVVTIGVPLASLAAGFAWLSAGLNANSVHDLPVQYIDAVGAKLGIAQDAYFQLAGGCEPSRLAPIASHPDGTPICFPTAVQEFNARCTIRSDMDAPAYIWPWDDLIEVRLAVAGVGTLEIAHYLEAFDTAELLRTGPLNNDGRMLAKKKTVTAMQCDGYGLIDIRQHYYD